MKVVRSVLKFIKKLRRIFYTTVCFSVVKSHGKGCHVNYFCKFSRNTTIGNDCHFNGMTICGSGNVTIGDHFHSGKEVLIITDNHNYDKGETLPYDHTYISKDVVIDENVWLGARVIILGGVHIGEGAVIQAGSVVASNIPPLAVAGGAPAKCFKMRDEEHYWTLKNNISKESLRT